MKQLVDVLEGILGTDFDITTSDVSPVLYNIIPNSPWDSKSSSCELDYGGYEKLYELGTNKSAAKRAGLTKITYKDAFSRYMPLIVSSPCIAVWSNNFNSINIFFRSDFVQFGKATAYNPNCLRIQPRMNSAVAHLGYLVKSSVPRSGSNCYIVPKDLALLILNKLNIPYTR